MGKRVISLSAKRGKKKREKENFYSSQTMVIVAKYNLWIGCLFWFGEVGVECKTVNTLFQKRSSLFFFFF